MTVERQGSTRDLPSKALPESVPGFSAQHVRSVRGRGRTTAGRAGGRRAAVSHARLRADASPAGAAQDAGRYGVRFATEGHSRPDLEQKRGALQRAPRTYRLGGGE